MIKALVPFAAAVFAVLPAGGAAQESPSAAPATTPQLSLSQSATLRCAAAFAIVAQGQANGNEAALAYPPMAQHGREFFVRTSAQLMDELSLDRAGIQALVSREAQALWDEGTLEDVMPACLVMLDAAGL